MLSVICPVAGFIAHSDYEHEFTLHQFTILPGSAAEKFRVAEFDEIKIARISTESEAK